MRVYLTPAFQQMAVDCDVELRPPRPGDAGYDLYAVEGADIKPGGRVTIPTGVHVEIPTGYVGIIKDRSSTALAGLHHLAGVIDASYRGEIRLVVVNTADTPYAVTRGQKIAQMIVVPYYAAPLEPVASLADLSPTERGEQGFGSTGS